MIVGGHTEGITGGIDAVNSNLSKRFNKMARFLDAVESTPYSHKQGPSQGFLCDRCKSLQKDDVWAAYDALSDVLPEVFAKQLRHIVTRRRFGLCILVVDATDPEHSAMKHMRRSVGKTPCWLVMNKVDLLPRMNEYDVANLRRRVEHILGSRFLKVFAVSAVTNRGVVDLCEAILANLGGRDIFLIGAANVGKTTLVRELATTIANAIKMKGKRGSKRRDIINELSVTGSHLPGTTLQAVRIPCFSKPGHAMWDTPGVINRKAIQYNIFPAHLMEPLARPEKIPIPNRENNLQLQVRAGYSVLIEAAWMEFETGYINPAVTSIMNDKEEDEEENDLVIGESDEEPTTQQPRRLGDPAVLARVDIEDIQEGHSLLVQAWIHPCLRVRVCRTSDAPTASIIPLEFQRFIEQKTKRQVGVGNEIPPIPLMPFIDKFRKRGEYVAGGNVLNKIDQYAMDVSFASLGWLTFINRSPYTLVPYCVEGSIWSKRRALYPMGMTPERAEGPVDEAMIKDDETDELIGKRLREAARIGRHSSGGDTVQSARYGGHDTLSFFNDQAFDFSGVDDDEWF